jgi:hypothetical protein
VAGTSAAVLLAAVAALEAVGNRVIELLLLQVAFGVTVWLATAGQRQRSRTLLLVAGLGAAVVMALGALWANGYDVALYQITGLPEACRRLIGL